MATLLDPREVRARTLQRVASLGFPDPPAPLPLLWDVETGYALRPQGDLVARSAVLNVVLGCSYGMPPAMAAAWIAENGLVGAVGSREASVIAGELGPSEVDRGQVEASQALAWMLSLVPSLDPERFCDDDLASRLPDLRRGETVAAWSERVTPALRSAEAAAVELDLHYCLTWGLADANLRGTQPPGTLPQHVYWQRRRAFEFAFGGAEWAPSDWDHLDLST